MSITRAIAKLSSLGAILAIAVVSDSRVWSQAGQDLLWSGQAQCQLALQSQGFAHQEIQTWTLTGGAPTQQGAMQIYPATWSVSGQGGAQQSQGAQVMAAQWSSRVPGISAPLAIFIRASDNRLIIKSWHSQLAAPNATVASRQVSGGQASSATAWVYEWQFPAIEDAATSTNVSGSGTITVTANRIALPAVNSAGIANCKWQFVKGSALEQAPAGSSLAANRPVNEFAQSPMNGGASATNTTNSAMAGVPAASLVGRAPVQNPVNSPIASAMAPLPAPTNFTATHVGNGVVQFSWQPVAGATKYHLEGTGVASTGLSLSAPPAAGQGIAPPPPVVQNVPPGPGTWTLAAVNSFDKWDPKSAASASAMVRYPPPHSPQWLTKSNGAGSSALTLAHYLSLCSQCIPGANLRDVMVNIGLQLDPLATFPDAGDGCGTQPWCGGWGTPWIDDQAARYTNVTEFENSARVTGCWNIGKPNGRIVCYTKTSDHGLQVIVKQSDLSWFLSFSSANSDFEIFDWVTYDSWQIDHTPLGQRLTSAYTLSGNVTLDSEGTKYPPHACLACHGGKVTPSGVTGATLLPIDPGLIKPKPTVYDPSAVGPSNVGFDAGNALKINRMVVDASPTASVVKYITGLYGADPHIATGPGDPNYVPPGWSQQANTYNTGVKPYCVMCHLAGPSNLDFTVPNNFFQNKELIYTAVCSAHSMPHAEAPYKAFWTKDTGPFFLPGWLAGQLGHQSCP